MQGRYGTDELNNALFGVFLVFWVVSLITGKRIFYWLGFLCLVYMLYRSLSRDHLKRSGERLWFLQQVEKVKKFFRQLKLQWRDRKTHRYFRCKQCGALVRVPKGKGQIEITCTKCGNKFIEKT